MKMVSLYINCTPYQHNFDKIINIELIFSIKKDRDDLY